MQSYLLKLIKTTWNDMKRGVSLSNLSCSSRWLQPSSLARPAQLPLIKKKWMLSIYFTGLVIIASRWQGHEIGAFFEKEQAHEARHFSNIHFSIDLFDIKWSEQGLGFYTFITANGTMEPDRDQRLHGQDPASKTLPALFPTPHKIKKESKIPKTQSYGTFWVPSYLRSTWRHRLPKT